MRILYKIGIRVYFFLVLIASPFNIKARRWLRGRRGMWRKVKKGIDHSKEIFWFHCSSLGEFEQGRPVMEKIKAEKKNVFFLLTFFSPSGYELRKNYPGADLVTYLPLDTRFNAWRFINLVKPTAVYFIKYEFWYYFLRTLYKKKIPVFLISAKFRPEQAFFKWWGKWYRKFLRYFTHLFVQDEQSLKLLKELGHNNVTVSGDTRFDRVNKIANRSKDYPGVELFRQSKKILIAGSTWEKDEEILLEYINKSKNDLKFILAPHEISKKKIYNLVSAIDAPAVRFTDEDKTAYPDARVMIIDTVGHLSSVYKYGDIAYIGGGFGKGIHNILEAATYYLPVIFGPNYEKFNEAVELIGLKAAFSINNYEELKTVLSGLLFKDGQRQKCAEIAGTYVRSRTGATDIIVSMSLKSI